MSEEVDEFIEAIQRSSQFRPSSTQSYEFAVQWAAFNAPSDPFVIELISVLWQIPYRMVDRAVDTIFEMGQPPEEPDEGSFRPQRYYMPVPHRSRPFVKQKQKPKPAIKPPKLDGTCKSIWRLLDVLKAKGEPIDVRVVIRRLDTIKASTIRTQYKRWQLHQKLLSNHHD